MKVCLFIASDDIIKNSNIYKEIILKNIKEFGSFTIINFNNILKKNKNLVNDKINISILKSKFGKKIDYFNPSSKIEFLQYIRADKIFAIDSLGKTFDYFSIRKLINKKNIKLVLIMNLGFLSNELFYSIKSFKDYLFNFKKIIKYLLY